LNAEDGLRAGRDEDAAGFIALISACWAEYPGCVFDLDGEVPELRALATYFAEKGGAIWVFEDGGRVAGMAGVSPSAQAGTWEICKMYVGRAMRGRGVAAALLARAEGHARSAGAERFELWSDTRFDRAHRFYEKHSFVRTGPIRALGDRSSTIEFHFAKPIDGIAALDAAGASSAVRHLADLLVACVDAGASVSFLPPLAADVARAFWVRMATEVAEGRRVLLAGWRDGVLAGTVTLDLGMPPNQPHRAEVQKLLVAPQARRGGLARALMARLEAVAGDAGRTLLTLDTRAEDAAERLYRTSGWTEAGRIPDFARNADGTLSATVLFWKRIGAGRGA
jgi:GNAT superfamily N-acetyltransferase